MWLQRFFQREAGKPAPAAYLPQPVGRAAPGFAEDLSSLAFPPAPRASSRPQERPAGAPAPQPRRGAPAEGSPFPGTGPHGHRGRLRSRLLERGPGALADYEVLEMLLFFAFKTGDTKPLAKALINRYGSFAAVLAAPQQELLETPGLGEHSVSALKLVQDAALRLARAEVAEHPVLNNWDRLLDYLNAAVSREKIEQFRILFLDSKNRLIADEAQARGTVNHTPVYPREVLRRALELHATALILVHNHPSGDPTPSSADIEMTGEIRRAAQVFSVVLHDHLIIGNGRHFSFRREHLL
ncbi:DNA repair protein RadC [Pseudoroseomonas cervicalis]|uniref:DNA repair protein RadC n=1 Tax=Pseudoroseomonas cervicalis ATCC 49957 TaxID=525371 RepID=D5RQC8_9PROT|nr:DNA repair protein RadC [Pseudoroseomonas cervicalis]EFH10498.1 DNA repair protein RadC [Pseudoroseomonas cervicalis ATCC 49957]